MRSRVGLAVLALVTTLCSPVVIQQATAFSGFASAPLSVTATAISGGLRVTWSAPTDVDTGVTGYRVEYSTSGTDATWNLAATLSSSTYSYDIVPLSTTATYVRVAATTSAGTGTYGYPWTKIYGTTALNRNASGYVTYEAGYGVGASDPFTTLSSADFTRIRWRLDTTISGVAKYAEADSYEWVTGDSTKTVSAWGPTISSIMVPSVNSPYAYSVQANVTDLNVYSDNTAVTNGKNLSGRLEIWPWNYSQGTSGLTGAGSASTYDYDDTNNLNGTHGSFQIHDMTNLKPVFVWNDTAYGASAAVAYGKNTNVNGNPDWTFCSTSLAAYGACPTPTSFKLQIFVNIPVTPLADTAAPTVTLVSASNTRNGAILISKSTETGTVYLVNQSVTVTNLASITAAASNLKNSVSITTPNQNTNMTLSGLVDGIYNLYAVDLSGNVSTPILASNRVDSTAPTLSSISVNSTGNSVLLTLSETATYGLFLSSMYSVSDSGTAMSVTGISASGNVVTLALSRQISAGANVSFSYTPTNGGSSYRILDLSSNELAAFSYSSITNGSLTGVSANLSVADNLSKGTTVTISVQVNVAGKVTFTAQGKKLPGCINKTAIGTSPITVTCSFKPAYNGFVVIGAVLVPTNSAYGNSISSQLTRFISRRTNNR